MRKTNEELDSLIAEQEAQIAGDVEKVDIRRGHVARSDGKLVKNRAEVIKTLEAQKEVTTVNLKDRHMSIMNESEIDYPRTVTVLRPAEGFDETGDYLEGATVIVSGMIADIQQSLKIRNHLNEDSSGTSDNTAWLMFCTPPVPLHTSDIVSDGDRTFIIDSVGDWGSHVECIMRQL